MSGAPLLLGQKTRALKPTQDVRRGTRSAALPRYRTVPGLGWFSWVSHDPVTSSQLGTNLGTRLRCSASPGGWRAPATTGFGWH